MTKGKLLFNNTLGILILFFFGICMADLSEEKITLNLNHIPFREALNILITEYHLPIVFRDKQVQGITVSVACHQCTAEETLDRLVEKIPFQWKRVSGQIVILPDENKFSVKKHTISGFITDRENGENLAYANIMDKDTHRGVMSNKQGFYSLTLPDGPVDLWITYIGYEPVHSNFRLKADTTMNIELSPSIIELNSISVSADKEDQIQYSTNMSRVDIPIRQMQAMPALLGETDPLKVLQTVPGVQSGMEGSSGLSVRGSSPDQNLILLDGVPVYNAYHMFGFISLFNASALKNVQLIKGGFPARYGGRLASVIDIQMKEGNLKKPHREATLGLVMSKILLEGPIRKDRSSYFITLRRTYLDWLIRPFIPKDEQTSYYALDLNLKVNHQFSDRDRCFFSGYFGDDKLSEKVAETYHDNSFIKKSESDMNLQWGNQTAALRWNHLFNRKCFSNIAATYTAYRIHVNTKEAKHLVENGQKRLDETDMNFNSRIGDWAAQCDFDILPNPVHTIRIGASSILHAFNPGSFHVRMAGGLDTTFNTKTYEAVESAAYAEDEIQLGRFKFDLGIRGMLFQASGKDYRYIEPRTSVRILLNEKISIKGSYAETTQAIHMLAPPGFDLPLDFWVPSTDEIRPERARQIACGFAWQWKPGTEITLESYHKKMRDIIHYQEGTVLLDARTNWDQNHITGTGEGYGAELFIQKKSGRIKGWAGYTLSWSNRHFEGLNNGKTFPFKYDRRHNINLAVTIDDLFPGKDFSINWVFGSGAPMTLPVASYYNPEYERSYIYTSRNGYRMQSYHRLDMGFTMKRANDKRESTWTFSLYNAYNRLNPFYIYYVPESNTFKKRSVFPIIPSISYTTTF